MSSNECLQGHLMREGEQFCDVCGFERVDVDVVPEVPSSIDNLKNDDMKVDHFDVVSRVSYVFYALLVIELVLAVIAFFEILAHGGHEKVHEILVLIGSTIVASAFLVFFALALDMLRYIVVRLNEAAERST
jgi:hypothetical protein